MFDWMLDLPGIERLLTCPISLRKKPLVLPRSRLYPKAHAFPIFPPLFALRGFDQL